MGTSRRHTTYCPPWFMCCWPRAARSLLASRQIPCSCFLAGILCAGSGKTELCKQFTEQGFWVLDEAFLDMPEYALHPQSLLMETSWVVNWFSRLLKHAAEVKGKTGPEPVRRAACFIERAVKHVASRCNEV